MDHSKVLTVPYISKVSFRVNNLSSMMRHFGETLFRASERRRTQKGGVEQYLQES
jgi:hypothetical protein